MTTMSMRTDGDRPLGKSRRADDATALSGCYQRISLIIALQKGNNSVLVLTVFVDDLPLEDS
jgi:hypothetical protein